MTPQNGLTRKTWRWVMVGAFILAAGIVIAHYMEQDCFGDGSKVTAPKTSGTNIPVPLSAESGLARVLPIAPDPTIIANDSTHLWNGATGPVGLRAGDWAVLGDSLRFQCPAANVAI